MSKPLTQSEAPPPDSTRTGPGRLLIAVYGLFALSATARALVQIATEFRPAPVASVLSPSAAVVYTTATATPARGSPTARGSAVFSGAGGSRGVGGAGIGAPPKKPPSPAPRVWSG